MEGGTLGTNGKLAWENEAGRWGLQGETIGRTVITTIQNFPAWRCRACHLLLFEEDPRA